MAKDSYNYPQIPGVFNPETFANELSENLNASYEPGGGSSDIAKGYAPKTTQENGEQESYEVSTNTTKTEIVTSPVQSVTLPSEEVVSDLLADDILGGEKYGVNTNVVRQQVLRPDNITEIRTKDRVIDFGTNGDIINPIDSGEILVDAQTTDEVKIPLKAQEKILTEQEAAAELKPQDYVATITEVLDANRIRVNLSYNDGVNKYQHKGEDERKKKFKNFKVNYIKNNIGRYKTYMVKDNHYYYLVTNEKISTDGRKKYFKFQQPLQNISVDDKVTFVEKRLPDYEDTVRLEPFIKAENNDIFLRIPNLNSVENPINFQGTTYNSNDGLLSNKQSDSDDIERLLVSSSLLDVQPNIDYQKTTSNLQFERDDTGFGNFVHFSNAERRLGNFKKKLELIEGYTDDSASLASISGSSSTISSINKKKQRVINSFDPYENFLYFESSSYASSSAGQFHDTCWPKSSSVNENGITSLFPLDSADATAVSWYNTMIESASIYDQGNMNSFRNSLPLHVNQDTENNVFLEFMDMVGQQFDEIWTYTKSITDLNVRVEKLSEGISKDVAAHYAQALGLNLVTGNDLIKLPEYLLGKDVDGTSTKESPQEEVTEEIWKRILANLPFFLKTKGTRRAITGLLNCYGIPSSMLRAREYGGQQKGTQINYEIKRKFTRATDFKAAQYIKSNWKAASDGLIPDTIEVRFRTPYSVGSSGSMVLLQKDDNFAISLQDNGTTDDYGYLRFTISGSDGSVNYVTSSLQKFYNDEFWSVMLTRKSASNGLEFDDDSIHASSSFELTTGYYESTRERIVYRDSASMEITSSAINAAFTSSGHIYLGGSGSSFGTQFSGSLMEYRLWSEPLSQSIFDNHTRVPKAYNGNHYSSSYDKLLVRYELNENKNLQTLATASNTAHDLSYESHSVDVNGFTGNFSRTLVDQEKLRIPDIGPSRRSATKIRIEDNTIPKDDDGRRILGTNRRNEISSNDFAPIDSNKLGVYFSPTDVVNEDIIYSVADFNFDDYIGDPRDQFKREYNSLRDLRQEYFKRYHKTNNFFDYLRILSFYDSSVFTQVKELLPARANSTLGILVEPNILERSKVVIGEGASFTNQYFENANHFEDGLKVTRYITGSNDNYFEVAGEYNTYNSEINLAFFDTGSSMGFLGNRSIMKLNEIDPKTEYGTLYATASVEDGPGTSNKVFTEVLQPNISQSRFAEVNEEKVYFYSSSKSASIGPTLAYSSSFDKSEFQSVAYDSSLFRTFYQGVTLTRENTIDGKEPIEVNQVAPTTIVTQDSDISKLRTE